MNLKTEALTQVQYYHCNYTEDEQCEERSFVCVWRGREMVKVLTVIFCEEEWITGHIYSSNVLRVNQQWLQFVCDLKPNGWIVLSTLTKCSIASAPFLRTNISEKKMTKNKFTLCLFVCVCARINMHVLILCLSGWGYQCLWLCLISKERIHTTPTTTTTTHTYKMDNRHGARVCWSLSCQLMKNVYKHMCLPVCVCACERGSESIRVYVYVPLSTVCSDLLQISTITSLFTLSQNGWLAL